METFERFIRFIWWVLKQYLWLIAHIVSYACVIGLLQFIGIPPPATVMVILASFLIEGWVISSYVRYRLGRQAEVLQLLRSTVATKMPLEQGFDAYLQERGERPLIFAAQGVLALLMTPLMPGAIYLWLVFYFRRFDSKLKQFKDELYEGRPLADAIMEFPMLLSPDARLAVRVGEETGRLELALERGDRSSVSAAWLELLPRLIYPLIVFYITTSTFSFVTITILPKYKKIFAEFSLPLPAVTRSIVSSAEVLSIYASLIGLAFLGTLVLINGAIASPTFRWHVPILGRYYRRDVQGRMLRMLGVLIEAEVPAPIALEILAGGNEFSSYVQIKLDDAGLDVDTGHTLATALAGNGLLPPRLKPLIDTAQSNGTLAWTLHELGDHLSENALRSARRLTGILMPILILFIGGTVLYAALGLFMPLVDILEALSQ